jgi:hypothetical protein
VLLASAAAFFEVWAASLVLRRFHLRASLKPSSCVGSTDSLAVAVPPAEFLAFELVESSYVSPIQSTEEYFAGEGLAIAGSVVHSSADYRRQFGTLPNRSRRASSHVLDVTEYFYRCLYCVSASGYCFMSTWYSDFSEARLSAQNAWYPGTGAFAI